MVRALALCTLLAQVPDVILPPKRDVSPPPRPNAEVVLEEVRRVARACGRAAPDAGDCVCAALRRTRFDVRLDGGTLAVSYPLNGVGGPSFTIDADGRVVACAF